MDKDKQWFKDGLKFKCTGCGKCCCGDPGYIWITVEELQKIAEFLKLTPQQFSEKYVLKYNNRLSIIEIKRSEDNYECAFLKNNRCEIYDVRPTQCRTYPWWPSILKSKKAWKEEAHFCEGISDNATIVPSEKILEQLNKQKEYVISQTE